MSPLEQVLVAARKLSLAGKPPSLALIKASLGNSLPMPILVQGLQRFKAMSADEQAAIVVTSTAPAASVPTDDTTPTLAQLTEQVARLTANQEILIERISDLEAKLNGKDAH
ncbi:hypothetical protein L1D29_17025 [Shewanella insulae]|uniref:KfrA N-terminal DNA-binding domain-containing protein n=1 Tax=Shewanella insulae TaxID=2681496 RepID=A0A6L7HVL9_9GAMM|nr:hypothetical protein [Shewanella insulae]MCG9714510.1 hypothetical protein [Shewanella insulae]MXR68255.1 hypothetical protein [Shewanella insulae]